MFFRKERSRADIERFDLFSSHGIVASIVFIMMLALIGLSWRTATQDLIRTREELIDERIALLKSSLESQTNVYDTSLRAGVGLLSGSSSVSRGEWKRFADSLQLSSRYEGVIGLGYAEVLNGDELATFEQLIRSEGFSDFSIYPKDTDREKYVVIKYLEPFNAENMKAFGYDMYSNQERSKTMDAAAQTKETAISNAIVLIQDVDNPQPGLLAFRPYFRNDTLEGYVYAPFRAVDLFEDVFSEDDGNFTFSVYDHTDNDQATLLYTRPIAQSLETTSVKTEVFSVFDKQWRVEFSATDDIVPQSIRQRPTGVLYGGLIFAIIVAGIVYLLLQRRARLMFDKKEREVMVAKDDLLSLASHQLRTPATGVKQYVGMVLEGFTGKISEKQRANLQRAYDSNERQLSIINEFLYLAKADAGRIIVTPQRFELTKFVKEILADMSSVIKEAEHKVKFIKPKKNIYVYVDRHSARMIIENVLSNAVKYTPRGGKITVKITANAQMASIAVTDNGVGIEAQDFPKLFRQFSRIPNQLTQTTSGSGIGLYLAKRLAKLNAGAIAVESQLGKGSTFTIELPIKNVKNHTEKAK